MDLSKKYVVGHWKKVVLNLNGLSEFMRSRMKSHFKSFVPLSQSHVES